MKRLILMAALAGVALVSTVMAQAQASPRLEDRATATANAPVPLDARITGPVNISTEAWGHYTFGRDLDLLEIDYEPQGLTGYITLLGEKRGPDKNAPLTFFFSKTRIGGDSVYFATQQIHRVSYEFNGFLEQSPPRDHTLEVEYSLVGTLTIHHAGEHGEDRKESKQVTFKKVPERLR